jgi:hypothetical protein
MNSNFFLRHFPFLFFLLLIAGCGNNEITVATGGSTLAVSESCIGCHDTAISKVTGSAITEEWRASFHNTETPGKKVPGAGASCRDCHEPEAGHPNSCTGCHGGRTPSTSGDRHDVVLNPDTEQKCLRCHSSKTLGSPHFNNYTAVTHDAQFVDLQNQGKCRNCHNPHKVNVLQEARDWAKSAHGDVKGKAWSEEDFKANKSCLRCHTAKGFIDYASSSFALATEPLAASESYGVLGCNACHTSYNFKQSVRQVPQHTAPYNGGLSPKTFPSVGQSNLCIPCHAGRESGDSVMAIKDFTNVSFKNAHYLPAAGLMYMTVGYKNFTSASAVIGTSTYGKSLSPDTSVPDGISGGVGSTHRKLGTPAMNGDNHNTAFFIPGNLDSNGPCVICHINGYNNSKVSRPSSHTLAISGDAFNQVCVNCHDSEGGIGLTADNFQKIFIEPQAEVFENALHLAITLLNTKYNIKYDPNSYPYFYDLAKDPTGKTAVKDWTRGTKNQKLGQKVMGACFNINILTKDPAAYVHARTYTRRLIYDTIDFLDDGKINLSASATAIATSPSIYKKGAQAYSDGTLTTLATGTSESMVYLIGWSRSTGKWNTPERP